MPVPAFTTGLVSVGARAYPAWLASVLRQIQSERIGGDVCTDSMELTVLSPVNSSELDCRDQVRSCHSFGVDVDDILTLSQFVLACAHNEWRLLGMSRWVTQLE